MTTHNPNILVKASLYNPIIMTLCSKRNFKAQSVASAVNCFRIQELSFSKESFILCLARLHQFFLQVGKTITGTTERKSKNAQIQKTSYQPEMKNILSFFTLLFIVILLNGCSKTTNVVETPEAKIARLLTGEGNRFWHLNKVYVNTVPQTLTDAQMKYTKTYTADPSNADPSNPKKGTFVNSDGYAGKWTLLNTTQLYETYTNNPSGPVAVTYIINEITANTLDIEYTANMKTVREVYYGY